MTPAGARDSSTAPVRQTARQPAPTTETKKAEPPVVTIVSPRETSAAVEIVSPGEISEAVQTFTDAVRRGDHETVERLYAKVESRDTDQLRMVLQLMREGGLEIAGLRARAGASAADGAARVELDAEARWRSPFGANRRRPIRLAAELGRSGATWRLVGVRIVGDGLE